MKNEGCAVDLVDDMISRFCSELVRILELGGRMLESEIRIVVDEDVAATASTLLLLEAGQTPMVNRDEQVLHGRDILVERGLERLQAEGKVVQLSNGRWAIKRR